VAYAAFLFFKGGVFISGQEKKHVRINNEIRSKEVRLIGESNNQLGIVHIEDANRMAQEAQLDLVEIAPNANPPVCKIMDFGKYLYELTKKEKDAKKKQHATELKEIQIRPNIFEHDLEIKLNHAIKFFEKKHKVKFVIRFRGRESQYTEEGMNLLLSIGEKLSELAIPDSPPKSEGRRIFQVFSPVKQTGKKKAMTQEDKDAKTENE